MECESVCEAGGEEGFGGEDGEDEWGVRMGEMEEPNRISVRKV